MKYFEPYKQARINIENRFKGLLHAHTSLIKSLITLANPLTGIVSDITYRDIADLLTISKAPGRTQSGTPQKETIRSYLRSIEKQCPEDFKIISEGQKLQFQFPKLPEIYAGFLENLEVYTERRDEQYISNPIEKSKKNDELKSQENTKEYTDLYTDQCTEESAVKNINIFNITNSNKQTETASNDFCRIKKPIGDDFYPNTKTIEMAFSMGLTKVTDKEEIQAFIKHNKKQNTLWADFNPVFINWLERDAQYMKKQLQKAQGQLRSHHNERGINQSTLNQTALERVSEHHGISIDSLWDTSGSELNSGAFIEGTLVRPLDEADCNIRATFYQ
ncbi:Vir protein [Legionella pneumophila]|uniref:Vir protein n=1 Tax=Legionella pneumophila TaxID=446 RepID=UPI00243402C4|nr:Vir protein [Legionella pneumophila]MDG5851944.1 Vir protein [Legionella pneumophila]